MQIIDLNDGEVREVDEGQLRELGMPPDFKPVDAVTTEEWIQALQDAHEG